MGGKQEFSIITDGLVKKFGELRAVDGISLKVRKGEVFGLLGPNGAGKTTLISMLNTLRRPTSGSAEVNGFGILESPGRVRESIGAVFQDSTLDDELTARENLELHAAMYGMGEGERRGRIAETAKMVGLEKRLGSQVKTYSGGMRRRLEIARGLMHTPKVLFLDEPTLGLDPQTRNHIWEYIRKMKGGGKVTVVLTTHYMDEADSLCDRIAIVDRGKVIALGTGKELKESLGGDVITVECKKPDALIAAVKGVKWVKGAKQHNGKATLSVDSGERRVAAVMAAAEKAKAGVGSVTLSKPTLDDVFLHYTGRTIREEEGSAKDRMRAFVAARRR